MMSDDMRGFSENLDALRDFVDLIDPIISGRAEAVITEQKTHLLPLVFALRQVDPDEFADVKIAEAEHKMLKKQVKCEIKTSPDGKEKAVSIKFETTGDFDPDKLVGALKEIRRNQTRRLLLFRSSLISLMSAVEWFFSRVLHVYFEKYPQIAISDDKVFSYEDLTHFSTVDEARKYLIERRVEDILRGSFSDWIKYFRGPLKLSMGYLDPCMDLLVETCERRNLLVHNNGVANNIYISKVSPKLVEDIKPGDQISVAREYLDQRITLFERCCILIAAEMWKQSAPTDEKRGTVIVHLAFEHMKAKRWAVSEGLSYFLLNDKKLPDRDIMLGKMNYWLSVKRQGRWDEVKLQAEGEDMSARDRLFQLAWMSLCEKKDDFFRLLPSALKAQDVDAESLQSFPIFDEMREDARFVKAVTQATKKTKAKSTHKRGATPAKSTISRSPRPK